MEENQELSTTEEIVDTESSPSEEVTSKANAVKLSWKSIDSLALDPPSCKLS